MATTKVEKLRNNKAWYSTNLLRPFDNWKLHNTDGDNVDAIVEGTQMIVPAKQYAWVDLSNSFVKNSLTVSDQREVILEVLDTSEVISGESQFCGSNIRSIAGCLTIDITGRYCDDANNDNVSQFFNITLTPNIINYKKHNGNSYKFIFYIDMANINLVNMRFRLRNNGEHSIAITRCVMRRSKDIMQLGENTITAMTVANVDAYKDGMKVTFADTSETLNCWWLGNQGDGLIGINVNNERTITFVRHDELLM